jgi:uncharacterized membrane protein YsdA (DUF1294 family)
VELHERELRAAEKRLAKLEQWVAESVEDEKSSAKTAEEEEDDEADLSLATLDGASGKVLAEQASQLKTLKRRVRVVGDVDFFPNLIWLFWILSR